MPKITSSELRKKYIEFFKSKGHSEISGASLIPENDPTVLFTTAGMHPLVPYLTGQKHPSGDRLVDYQRCIRTGDIDEVGDNTHLTFFEMLGNWSLGDYFKEDAIKYSFEFLTSQDWLGLPLNKLAVTVFEGDKDAPKDEEATGIWESLGMPKHKISYMPKKDNWWGPAGQTGPCGPDTEMFYYIGEGEPSEDSNVKSDPDNWVEIWNDVFMQYHKNQDGTFEELKQKNVDTGMGLERTVAVLNGHKTVYETDIFKPLIDLIQSESTIFHEKSARIVADHIRAVSFMGMDGIIPSNVDQGYVMRRLLRRVVRQLKLLGIEDKEFIHNLFDKLVDMMGDAYPKLREAKDSLREVILSEVEQFEKALEKGLKIMEKLEKIDGKIAFDLYQTYGFPLEMIQEELEKKGLYVDEKEFDEEFKKHQDLSRAGSEQKFKGGLADHSEETTKLHTATHLLHQALRTVLGDHVEQKGSNITVDRLRFDFSHPEKMTDEEKKQVEDIVNEAIQSGYKVWFEEMSVEEAKEKGAIGLFEHKYGEKVKVYTMGHDDENFYSREICGGPHVEHFGVMGRFKIKKEESSSKGIRRIKAILISE